MIFCDKRIIDYLPDTSVVALRCRELEGDEWYSSCVVWGNKMLLYTHGDYLLSNMIINNILCRKYK